MKVIKKDGRVQEFSKDKIYVSLNNAGANTPDGELNESDIRIIVSDIVKKLEFIRKDNSNTSSYEIRGVIIDILISDGFSEVLKTFINY